MKKEIEQALKDLEEIEIHITKRLEKGGIIKVGEMIICEQVNTIKSYIEELENKLKRIEEELFSSKPMANRLANCKSILEENTTDYQSKKENEK